MSFDEEVRAAALEQGLVVEAPGHPEPLALLDYAAELRIKQEALRAFWERNAPPGVLRPLVPAPRPRGYRTTSKRRASLRRGAVVLGFTSIEAGGADAAASALDLPEHVAVYAFLQEELRRPASRGLAAALNFAIVRGSPGALAAILNLRAFDGPLVRRGKQLARALAASNLGVRSAFLYLDPTGSDYYLEARRPKGVLSFKRLYGPEALTVTVEGRRLRFPPTVFSQVNEAMLPRLTQTARELLGSLEGRDLLDLYCGYGLLSLCVGDAAAGGIGIDWDGPAIEAAEANGRALGSRVRFVSGRLDGEWTAKRLRPSHRREIVLLDPPRQGTEPGVIEALARRRPERVLHIICGTDEMPGELLRWRRAGYGLETAVPLDLFPGTANLETLVALKPASR